MSKLSFYKILFLLKVVYISSSHFSFNSPQVACSVGSLDSVDLQALVGWQASLQQAFRSPSSRSPSSHVRRSVVQSVNKFTSFTPSLLQQQQRTTSCLLQTTNASHSSLKFLLREEFVVCNTLGSVRGTSPPDP